MTSDVAEIHDEFQKIEEILYLSTRMQLAEDEEVIIGTLLIDFVYTKKRLVLQRQAVNLSAGVCGGSSLVSEKSREALRLFSQANNIIELLEAKLMRSR